MEGHKAYINEGMTLTKIIVHIIQGTSTRRILMMMMMKMRIRMRMRMKLRMRPSRTTPQKTKVQNMRYPKLTRKSALISR